MSEPKFKYNRLSHLVAQGQSGTFFFYVVISGVLKPAMAKFGSAVGPDTLVASDKLFFVLLCCNQTESQLKDHTQTRCPFISFCWNPSPATRGIAIGHVRLSFLLHFSTTVISGLHIGQ